MDCYRYLIALLLAHFTSTVLAQGQQCYYPNGNVAPPSVANLPWTPCGNGESTCCFSGDSCMSNNLCFGGGAGGFIYRGACTDQAWGNDTVCPTKFCNNWLTGTWANLFHCPATDPSAWWCGYEATNPACTAGPQMTWLDIDWANVTDRGAASPTSAKSASSATETILIAVATNILTPEQCTMPTWNRAMTLGISLGVPLGILVLGFLGFLFWKERRFRKTDRPPRPMTEVSEVAAGSPLPPSFKSQENFKSQETFKIQENFKSQERFKI